MNAHPRRIPHHTPAAHALQWLREGWRLFATHPGEWVLMALLILVSLTLVGIVPMIGRILAMVLLQILAGGMLAAAHSVHETGKLRFSHFFDGFRLHPGNLALVGMLFGLALTLAGFATFLIAIVISAVSHLLSNLPFGLDMLVQALFADWTVTLVAVIVMLLALWFAPALVMLDRVPPFDAMRLSLRACLRNGGATLMLAAILAIAVPAFVTLTLGFGIFIVVPLVATTVYASYRDVFQIPDSAPEAAQAPDPVTAPDSTPDKES